MLHIYSYAPFLWVEVYELAIAEKSPEHRQQLLLEAKKAITERARGLEEACGSDFECMVLEEAAAAIADLTCIDSCLSCDWYSFDTPKLNYLN